jgi:hypothetical protein
LLLLLLQDVKPGRARVMQCLVENMAKPNFGEECRAELKKREEAVKSDYRWAVASTSLQVGCLFSSHAMLLPMSSRLGKCIGLA